MGLLLAAAFLLGSVAQKHGPPVPRLIIDTDIGGGGCNDVDDVVAVWCVRQEQTACDGQSKTPRRHLHPTLAGPKWRRGLSAALPKRRRSQ